MNFRRRIAEIKLVVFSLVAISTGVLGSELNSKSPRFKFPYLTEPSTLAIELEWSEQLRKYGPQLVSGTEYNRRFDLQYNISSVFPLAYHPESHFTADISLGANWIIREAGTTVTMDGTSVTSPGNPRFGSGDIALRLELGRDSISEKWRTRNYVLRAHLSQDIPGTAVDLIGGILDKSRMSGNMPAIVEVSIDRVFETAPGDSSYFRGNLSFFWGLQLVDQFYLYPSWEITQPAHSGAHSYFRGELLKYFKGGIGTGSGQGVMFFIRFTSGSKPPEFIDLNRWDMGVGISI